MTALAAERGITERLDLDHYAPVLAATKIFQGAIVCLDVNGFAKPGATATTLKAWGVAMETVDNTAGASGDKNIRIRAGTFRFVNGETITRTSLGAIGYITDDNTIGKTATGKSPVGLIVDVDSIGVWVAIKPEIPKSVA